MVRFRRIKRDSNTTSNEHTQNNENQQQQQVGDTKQKTNYYYFEKKEDILRCPVEPGSLILVVLATFATFADAPCKLFDCLELFLRRKKEKVSNNTSKW
jgi:hypothetical protein